MDHWSFNLLDELVHPFLSGVDHPYVWAFLVVLLDVSVFVQDKGPILNVAGHNLIDPWLLVVVVGCGVGLHWPILGDSIDEFHLLLLSLAHVVLVA